MEMCSTFVVWRSLVVVSVQLSYGDVQHTCGVVLLSLRVVQFSLGVVQFSLRMVQFSFGVV